MVVGGHPGGFGQSLYQARRDDEHQLGLIGLELGAAGQRAENRYFPQPRKAFDGLGDIVFDEAGNDQTLPVIELHRGVCASHRKRGNDGGDAIDGGEG